MPLASQWMGRHRDGHRGAPRATVGAGRCLHHFPADHWAVTGRLGLTLAARNCRGGVTRMKLQTWAAPLSPAFLERRITEVSNTGYSMGKQKQKTENIAGCRLFFMTENFSTPRPLFPS